MSKERIQKWIDKNGIMNYFLFDDYVTFQFLVGDNRKRFLSYIKRLYGERQGYNYESKARVEQHFFNGYKVVINNY